MIIKKRNRTRRKLKNLSHQDQDRLRETQEEVAELTGELHQQEAEELYETQGILQDGVQDRKIQLNGQEGQDLDPMGGATLQGKERRRRRTLGWQ